MKTIKKIYLLLTYFAFVGAVNNVIAIETLEKGVCLKFSAPSVATDDSCSQLNYIYTSNSAFIRTTDLNVIENEGITCTIDNDFNRSEAIGEAYIINKITGQAGGTKSLVNSYDKYYWLNLVTAKYMNSSFSSESNYVDALNAMQNANFNNLINEANNYKNVYSKEIKLKLSADNLEFTRNNDGNYYSQKVYLTDENNNADISFEISDTINFEILDGLENNKKYFQVRSKNNISLTEVLNVTVTVKGNNTYYEAVRYSCTNDSYFVSSVTNEMHADEFKKSISGSLIPTNLTIRLENEDGSLLNGASFRIESKENNYSELFTTTSSVLSIDNLKYGEYVITQLSAPKSYVKYSKSETINLNNENLQTLVKLNNYKTKVEISNLKGDSDEFVVGSKLQIESKEGKVLYNWISESDIYTIEGIESGTYYLVQKEAPEGYLINSEKIEFTVDDSKDVLKVKLSNVVEVKVPDTLSSRSILLLCVAMFDIALGIGIFVYVKKNKIEE